MLQFFVNRPQGFESAVKAIVKNAFPFATGSTVALQVTERELRGAVGEVTTTIPGSSRERFVWGISRMGDSRVVG